MDDVDRYFVARTLAGEDPEVFGELVRRHQSQVRLFLLRLCRDGAQADDLAQDAFLHAWQKLPGFQGHGSFIGWLLKIAWTIFLQARRRGDRYREVVAELASVADQQAASGAGEELGDLDRLLAALTEEERAVMILSYACGLSHREISAAIDMPVGSVKSVIHRGKQKIRNDFDIENHQHG